MQAFILKRGARASFCADWFAVAPSSETIAGQVQLNVTKITGLGQLHRRLI